MVYLMRKDWRFEVRQRNGASGCRAQWLLQIRFMEDGLLPAFPLSCRPSCLSPLFDWGSCAWAASVGSGAAGQPLLLLEPGA